MRPVLPGDLSAAARALLPVAPRRRRNMAERLIHEACVADAFCRQRGRAHARLGNGTLMAAAHGHDMMREISFDDPDFIECMIHVLSALRAFHHPDAQETQRRTDGSRSSRFPAILSPQSSQ